LLHSVPVCEFVTAKDEKNGEGGNLNILVECPYKLCKKYGKSGQSRLKA
jgi:hypothetical protein